jgi:hypothetical protein
MYRSWPNIGCMGCAVPVSTTSSQAVTHTACSDESSREDSSWPQVSKAINSFSHVLGLIRRWGLFDAFFKQYFQWQQRRLQLSNIVAEKVAWPSRNCCTTVTWELSNCCATFEKTSHKPSWATVARRSRYGRTTVILLLHGSCATVNRPFF